MVRVRKHTRLPLVTYLRGGERGGATHYSYGEGSLTIHMVRDLTLLPTMPLSMSLLLHNNLQLV